ncbi:hypothetical protein J6590_020519 [Homalodisca vitripennis]|nr:hypothetical protein J6590_020519 [Homalodisca vitripennis]
MHSIQLKSEINKVHNLVPIEDDRCHGDLRLKILVPHVANRGQVEPCNELNVYLFIWQPNNKHLNRQDRADGKRGGRREEISRKQLRYQRIIIMERALGRRNRAEILGCVPSLQALEMGKNYSAHMAGIIVMI